MPPGSTQYTLVGFTAELDWRPLRFVKPIPQNRVCDACGLVRKRTALLPCRHVLCESCYELSTQDGGRVCPLDRQQWEEEDVELKEFPADKLLKREAQCWNEGRGCGTVLPASEIAHHFHRECRHHSICCPKCSTAVLSTDVFAHLNSECCTPGKASAHECESTSSHNGERALLTSFRQSLEEQAGDMKGLMERLLVAYDAVGDRLSEVGHGVNSCQEALREELREAVNRVESTVRQEVTQGRTEHRDDAKKYYLEITALNEETRKALTEELRHGMSRVKETVRQEAAEVKEEHRDCVQKCSDQISALNEETKARFDAVGDTNEKISQNIHALEKVFRDEMAKAVKEMRIKFTQVSAGPDKVEGEQVDERKNAASGMDEAVPKPADRNAAVFEFVVKGFNSLSDKVLRERVVYETKPVYLRGYCMSFSIQLDWNYLRVFVRPRKGDMDDVLQWPFQKIIRALFVHPKGGTDRELTVYYWDLTYCFQRLREGGEQWQCFCAECISPLDLIRDGYVEDDQLRLKFELLP